MNKKSASWIGWMTLAGVGLLVLGLLALRQWAQPPTVPATATAQVKQAWTNVSLTSNYVFSADVTIKTIPLPTPGNIGRFSQTNSLYLEGSNDLPNKSVQLALWGGGVSVADRANAYQVRVVDGVTQTRVGDGEWQASQRGAISFAPEGDFLAFVEMAKNVTFAKERIPGPGDPACAVVDCSQLMVYTFDLDPAAYAERLRAVSQTQMIRDGQLPPGATTQIPKNLTNVTGSGELWVDGRGLPVREKVNIAIPAAPGADNRSETVMDIRFTHYQGGMLAATNGWQRLESRVASIRLPKATDLSLNLGILFLALLAMFKLVRPSHRTHVVATVIVLIAMVFTPLLQVHAMSLANGRIAVQKTRQATAQQEQSFQQQVLDIQNSLRTAAPYSPPATYLNSVAASSSAQAVAFSPKAAGGGAPAALQSVQAPALDALLDSDSDGLTDAQEELIGTNPYAKDTDSDGILDNVEVTGFSYSDKMWYGNPNKADSNGDGTLDGVEWNPTSPDQDGDGVPDLYDFDDDGDGVPDDVDVSRLVASKDDTGTLTTFTRANPLQLTIDGLNTGSYTFVELQIRPTNPDHLWYAYNVMNWPHDEKGNMQDWDGKTFFDFCVANGGSNCQMTPDANGDLKLTPTLEITVNSLNTLPTKADGSLDTALLGNYNIAVRPGGNGTHLIYAPLNLVLDSVTGDKVAFQTQLVYQPRGDWKPQQVRMVWTVNALNEQYADPETAANKLKAQNGRGDNFPTLLYAYDDAFQLTGLNVREDRGVDMAIVYEDPALDPFPNEDDALVQMAYGLDSSFLTNRDCEFVNNQGKCVGNGQRDITIPEIYRRWNHTTNSGITAGQMWGLDGNYLTVSTHAFKSQDEATMVGGTQLAPAILAEHFTGTSVTAPAMLFVRESKFRAINADARSISWTGSNLRVNFSGQNVTSVGSFNLAPYKYNTTQNAWEAFSPKEYVEAIRTRYAPPTTSDTKTDAETLQEAEALFTAANVAVIMTGESAVLSQNATQGGYSSLAGVIGAGSVFTGADLSDAQLRQNYIQGISAGVSRVPQIVRVVTNQSVFSNELLVSVFKLSAPLDENMLEAQFALAKTQQKAELDTKATNVRMGLVAFEGLLLVSSVVGLILTTTGNAQGKVAGEIILSSVNAISKVYDAIKTYQFFSFNFAKIAKIAESSKSAIESVLQLKHSITSASGKAAAIGAAIGIAVTWAVFFAAWGTSGLSTDSVEFNKLLAGAIASTILVLMNLILSLSVVGLIVQAVFAVLDLIALIVCKAGVKEACDLGVTTAMTKMVTDWLYTGAVMIDTAAKPALTNIQSVKMQLTHPDQGLIVGNSVRFQVDILSVARHAHPAPSIIYHYGNFYTEDDLRSTTVRYSLDATKRTNSAELDQSTWGLVRSFARARESVPTPVLGWLLPITIQKILYEGLKIDKLTSGVYPFDSAQINQTFPLYLNTGMALPRYDCWFQACVHKSAKSTSSTDLSDQFILDILPATLDEFVNWSQLGPQVDLDGDGLNSTIDPNPTKADTDGDGVPDGVERWNGTYPLVADGDGDGLNDGEELRYNTNPFKADTDGDGLSDYDEAHGYNLTLGGRSVHVTSDPTLRDTDGDGMSDGIERRLNAIDATRYPFNPRVYNDPPVRIFTTIADLDRVLAVGASTTVTTTVVNGTAVENALMAGGQFSATLPSQLGSAAQSKNFTLLPTASTDIVLNGTAATANGTFSITTGVAANLAPVGNPLPTAPFTDIILDDPVSVTIDNDPPNVPALTLGSYVQPGRTVIIGGTASDPTSYVAQVDVSVDSGGFNPATGAALWAFPVDIPDTPTGTVPVSVRASDAVSNTNSANFDLTIDGVPPALTVGLHPGDVRQVRRNAADRWTLVVAGTVTDTLSGVASLSVQIGTNSTAVIAPNAIGANGAWSLTYVFSDPGFNADPRPSGAYTLTVTAQNNALPDGNPITQIIPFQIDMIPPTVALLSHKSETQLTDGAVLTGTVRDTQSGVAGVDIAFVSAQTALATESALLDLAFNDLPQTVLFANTGISQTQVYCLDESCPTSGGNGADGSAATFDGSNDLLRLFEPLDLPESGLTTSLWFNTTCANCGLFTVTQGQFPTITGHDRDLYLNNGNVCSSVLTTGGVRDVRCSVKTFNDGAWHQVVQTLGSAGNALYVDGDLTVSSPVTASTFTAQDGVLIGYAPAATAPYFNGSLDALTLYAGALAPESVANLYRKWQPVTVSGGEWSFTLPAGIEGYTQIDMRATDSLGNRTESRGDWPQFRGPIDTKAPTFEVTAAYKGSGSSAQTTYRAVIRDENLTADNFDFVCPAAASQLSYRASTPQQSFTGQSSSGKLSGIDSQCTVPGFQSSLVSANACDTVDHCAAAVPPQSVAYIGTTQNQILPYGSLPNAIERANLSDPSRRVRLIERPGRLIVDIAVDELHGMLYWAEMTEGNGAQPGGVWRANLDGSAPQQVVSGLTPYAPEALQIALDPAGNKIYWTKGTDLWWANLDGTLPQIVYSIPPDPGFLDGSLAVMGIGDVVIDTANSRLYMSELRQRGDQAGYASGIRAFPQLHKQTLIVSTNLNGQNPEFVAGAGAGCTYANFYQNKGYGVGAGQNPILCLLSGTDGFDVESMTVSNGTLYWSAINSDGVSSGVYGKAPGQAAFLVAPLGLPGNTGGRRMGPLPQIYVNPVSLGVFVQVGTEIVRGESDGEFTRFTTFQNSGATIAPGTTQRSSSTLSAMTIIQTPQETQTAADLAVGITSPALVLVNGETARYDIALRNDAALAATSTVLTLALPDGATFAGSNVSCTDGGATVTCNLGRFAPLTQQTVAISFTLTTATVGNLTATASVASLTAERTPANNSATHTGISAAPALTALSGIPYIYYGDTQRLTRVGLFGDNPVEPLFMTPGVSGDLLAADLVRNRLYIVTASGTLIAVNPDGGDRIELANTNPDTLSSQWRNRVAVDESTGRVYWSQITTLYLTTIMSANGDGSDIQTVVSDVRNQRGLLVDSIKRKLYWVGGDLHMRQDLIFRSNLDGSNLEVVYTAPERSQIRELAIDPYTQKLYWFDPTRDGGLLLRADTDGGRLEILSRNNAGARGLIVRPEQNALYYVHSGSLYRVDLNADSEAWEYGDNQQWLADLDRIGYTGLSLPVNPTAFQQTFIMPPTGNLAYVNATPFAAPPCVANDGHEPNNNAATAKAIPVGSTTGALCTTDMTLPQDIDFYQISVANNKQLDITLSNLPADYGLYVQRAGQTLATSVNAGLTNETIALPNYQGSGDYIIVVFSGAPVNNPAPYTLAVSLSDAPARTSFTDAECLAVDPADAAGLAGNFSQSQATALTVGQVITGALCYKDDIDFYKFNATAGQQMRFTLPVRPANYDMHIYRPNGSFYNAFNAATLNTLTTLDTTGTWAVAVRSQGALTPTTNTYQLLVSDGRCGVNDSWEPNDTTALAASLGAPGRVKATLCDTSDSDFYRISASPGQTLTVNYPANGAGGVLRVLNPDGGEVGRVQPGSRGNFVLTAGGDYTLAAANSSLTGSDVPYMFQWQLNAPTAAAGATPYLYMGNFPHLVRVALTEDHSAEPINIDGGATNLPLAADLTRSKLFWVDHTDALVSVDFDGRNRAVIVPDVNPDGVIGIEGKYQNVAVDEVGGRIFWLKPYGGANSTSAYIMRTNLDGGGEIQIDVTNRASSLLVDQVRGDLYWVNGTTIYRSDLNGNGVTTERDAAVGQEISYLTIDPLARHLYWIDTGSNRRLMRRSLLDGSETTLISGLGNAHGLVLRPERGELYYSNDSAILRAGLDGSNPTAITTLNRTYNGSSNLDPNTFVVTYMTPPAYNMVSGFGTPIVSPCAVADGHEPNNSAGTATPLTVVTETVAYGALCNVTFGAPIDWDYYTVTVASGKVLTVTLSQLPADYTLVVIHPNNYAAAFSNNPGLADESGTVTNSSGSSVTYTVIVQPGFSLMNIGQYKLHLALGDAPLPPDPTDAQCGAVDSYDTPGTGNGTLATATPLTFGVPLAAALCYVDDIDMYVFTGLAGQTVSLDLPTRPQDYDLTLYDPAGAATTVISSTTTPAYGASVTLPSSGLWKVAVSVPNLTPTTEQYQLVVTDQNCVAADANEPNNGAAFATPLGNGSRVRATLCNTSDVELYSFSATSGQQLTLNYPANATGGAARIVRVADDSSVGQVTAGGQGIFTIPADGDYRIVMENGALAGSNAPYQFELLVGTPTAPPSGSPYIYYSRVGDLMRVTIDGSTVEPILLPDTFAGGSVLASDAVRGKLYILDYSERIVQVNPDSSGPQVVVADTSPNLPRSAKSLAVDERSGRIFWMQPTTGFLNNLLSANGDGSTVQTLVTDIDGELGLAVDPVGGWLYWAQNTFYNNAILDVIRRSNLDGTDVETVYAAPAGRQIRELTVDPFAQTLYWRDPTQNRLLRVAATGGTATTIADVGDARGFVVRPLLNELYYTNDHQLWRAALDGSNPVALARLEGAYSGVSNLDANVFYPTTITPPGSNLILAYSTPFAQPCTGVDAYEPNNSLATAAAITPGTFSAALCTPDLANIDEYDYYTTTVASGKQITATLSNLPQPYTLILMANGVGVGWDYGPGAPDKALTDVNRSGSPIVYGVLVARGLGNSSRLPYTLNVAVEDAPPSPPPPPPPVDGCLAVDAYDQPGVLGNQTRATATEINFNETITAALCYSGDKDAYTFDGVAGQNVTIDLPVRPADYLVSVYNPDGQYVTGIFPGSPLGYGGNFTLNATGRWSLIVWDQNLVPTTSQYQLLLSVNTACSGLDPYEPNNDQGNERQIITRTLTLRAMLCEADDNDGYRFPFAVGDRVRIDPRILTPGMKVFVSLSGGGSIFELNGPLDEIVNTNSDLIVRIYPPGYNTSENLPYEIDVQIDAPAPWPPTTPNNWTCTIYPSSDIPRHIDDLATVASTVDVPTSGAVTRVSLRDLTLQHTRLSDLSFGLAPPSGAPVDLFGFDEGYCGSLNISDCLFSIDDAAIEGLLPPSFPTTGDAYRPNRNNFAPVNGTQSNGTWTLLVSDNGLSFSDDDTGDTTGNLIGWSLEVCIDNGQTPDPTPAPTATPMPAPQPDDGAPQGASANPVALATPTPEVCTPTADAYESDNTYQTASIFDVAAGSSVGHTFHAATDVDWQQISLLAGLQYTLIATTLNPAQIVGLTLYDTDGVTSLAIKNSELTFAPTVSGNYYVRAASGSGLGLSLCSSGYSLLLSASNPAATPVPDPVAGAALPPDHTAPPLSAAVLLPVDGTILTQTQLISLTVGLNAVNNIAGAEIFVNGASLAIYAASGSDTDITWQIDWTPPQAGVFGLTAVITDGLGMTATGSVTTVYVDLADPTVSITAETITVARLESNGSYTLHGTATDDSQIDKVEVRLDSGAWQQAELNGDAWSLTIAPLAQANPDGGSLSVETKATDKATRTAMDSASVTVDVTPPDSFAITPTLISSGAIITPSVVNHELGARLTWPAISGATSIHAGWADQPTPNLGNLTAYGAGAGSHDQTLPEGSALYAHVVAVDAVGNQTAVSSGPYLFDGPQTPDLIVDLALSTWVDAGSKQVGQMSTASRGVQKLFAGWDEDRLRLRWQGFDLGIGDDFFFYLGTGGGGTTDLFNPYGAAQTGVLPFVANYMVRLSDGVTPTLFRVSGGSWISQTQVAAVRSGDQSDVLIPFAVLGIANPAAASLKLLGVASAAGGLNVWATLPDQNVGRTWNQFIDFASLGGGIVPSAGVWADTVVEVVGLTAHPAPTDLLGAGDTVNVTVTVQNTGSAPLPSLTVDGTTTGGFTLANAPQVASSIAPSATVALTLNGTVNAKGSVALTLADSFHRPYALPTLTYAVDSSAPISVSVAVTYVVPYTNTVYGFAQDESAISLFELDAGGNTTACAPTGTTDVFQCVWNAGAVADGAALTLNVRATDVHGNASVWNSFPVTVDAAPPSVVLSAVTLTALSDGRLNTKELSLSGTLTDTVAVNQVQLCADNASVSCAVTGVQPDTTWTLSAPALGDGVTTTLAFVGYDLAGNASEPVTRTVVVDSVTPQFGLSVINAGVFVTNTASLLGFGTVSDGDGVATMQIYVVKPDGSSLIAPALFNGGGWSANFVFDQTGSYQVLAVATDRAGNQATQTLGTVTAFPGNAAPRAPALAASGVNPTTVILTWDHVTQDVAGNPLTVVSYNVYRSTNLSYTPLTLVQTVEGPFGATVTAQVTDGGQRGLSVYKVVAVTDQGGTLAVSSASPPVAKFSFDLVAGPP